MDTTIDGGKQTMMTLNGMPYNLVIPTRRYMDEFIRCKSSIDLMELKVFPDSKEITESFGAYNAFRKYFRKLYNLSDEDVTVVVVGDGCSPRTGATFAFRSKFQVHSVDPNLKFVNNSRVNRLHIHAKKIEDCQFEFDKVIIVHVHAHVKIETSLKHIKGRERHVIAMPCCVPQDLVVKPDKEYRDWGIFSPKNNIKIWYDV